MILNASIAGDARSFMCFQGQIKDAILKKISPAVAFVHTEPAKNLKTSLEEPKLKR
jgi:hypothetical protein